METVGVLAGSSLFPGSVPADPTGGPKTGSSGRFLVRSPLRTPPRQQIPENSLIRNLPPASTGPGPLRLSMISCFQGSSWAWSLPSAFLGQRCLVPTASVSSLRRDGSREQTQESSSLPGRQRSLALVLLQRLPSFSSFFLEKRLPISLRHFPSSACASLANVFWSLVISCRMLVAPVGTVSHGNFFSLLKHSPQTPTLLLSSFCSFSVSLSGPPPPGPPLRVGVSGVPA